MVRNLGGSPFQTYLGLKRNSKSIRMMAKRMYLRRQTSELNVENPMRHRNLQCLSISTSPATVKAQSSSTSSCNVRSLKQHSNVKVQKKKQMALTFKIWYLQNAQLTNLEKESGCLAWSILLIHRICIYGTDLEMTGLAPGGGLQAHIS